MDKVIILVVFIILFFSLLIFSSEYHRCGNTFHNEKIAGCGISQADLEKQWCEENAGEYFLNFVSGNCIFKPK